MILNGIFEIFMCPMIILEIYDQKWAGIALLGNSRVLKCYRDCLNLGHSVWRVTAFQLASTKFSYRTRRQDLSATWPTWGWNVQSLRPKISLCHICNTVHTRARHKLRSRGAAAVATRSLLSKLAWFMRVNPQEVCPINSSTGFEIRCSYSLVPSGTIENSAQCPK